jgi:hypothetical protein
MEGMRLRLLFLFALGFAASLTCGLAVAGCGDGFSAGATDSGATDATTDGHPGADGPGGDDGTPGGDDGGADGPHAHDADSSVPPQDGNGGDGIAVGDVIVSDAASDCGIIAVTGGGCFQEAGMGICLDPTGVVFTPHCFDKSNPGTCANYTVLCASGAECPSLSNPVCCAKVGPGSASGCSEVVQTGFDSDGHSAPLAQSTV